MKENIFIFTYCTLYRFISKTKFEISTKERRGYYECR